MLRKLKLLIPVLLSPLSGAVLLLLMYHFTPRHPSWETHHSQYFLLGYFLGFLHVGWCVALYQLGIFSARTRVLTGLLILVIFYSGVIWYAKSEVYDLDLEPSSAKVAMVWLYMVLPGVVASITAEGIISLLFGTVERSTPS